MTTQSSMKFAFILLAVLIAAAGIAQAQTSPIAPNGIAFTDNASTLAAGAAQNITVQILYNGGPLKSEGVRVYVLANDTSRIQAELGTYVLTDKNGIATYTAAANKTGIVKLTVTAMSVSSGVSANKVFQIIEGGAPTPTAAATATPAPSATAQPTTTQTATPTVAPTATPTAQPTAAPTAVPTTVPAVTLGSGDTGAQARGIIAIGIVLAVLILVVYGILQLTKKK